MKTMTMIENDHLRVRAARRLGRLLACSLTLLMVLLGALAGRVAPSPAHAAGGQAGWNQLSPSASPSARSDASIAYDPATRQIVLFGGDDGSSRPVLNDTWTWDGSTWTQQSPAASPPAMYDASMAYDLAHRQLLLFGGHASHGAVAGTWSWDGSTWTELSPAASPPARSGATMAFDQSSGRMILFGGADDSTGAALGDTWSWDGSTWTQLSPAASPPAREFATMDYDPARGRLVLFGGAGGDVTGGLQTNLSDTWSWTGSTWQQLSPASSPSARYSASMAYDPATDRLLLFGGFAGNISRDVWNWDGSTWSETFAISPLNREGAGMAYDAASGQLLLFGGFGSTGRPTPDDYLADTWAYTVPATAPAWSQLNPASSPQGVTDPKMAYDPATHQFILLDDNLMHTWNWDGSTWNQFNVAGPPSRLGASMAYDPATRQLIRFGGGGCVNVYNACGDTWSWDGRNWTQRSSGGGPDPRMNASMAFDPATGQLLLFGGVNIIQGFQDTWGWDGSAWHRLSSGGGPDARTNVSMGYDPASGQFLLFGGVGGSGYGDADTWSWDGTAWTQLHPAASPPGREQSTMAFDPASGQFLLFGGNGDNGALADTWSWDGSTWRQYSPATSPPARIGAGMDYDPTSGQLLLFGGFTITQTFSDTWGWSSGPNMPVHVDVSSGPPQVTGGTSATLAFAASGGSGALTYTCRLDTPGGAGSPGPCDSSTGMAYNNLTASGVYKFTVSAADTIGDAGSASYSWTLDTTPPVISDIGYLATPGGPNPFNPGTYLLNGGPPVNFTCSDAYDQVTSCSASVTGSGISGATVVNNGDPLPTSMAGTFTLTVNAQDQAGNSAQRQVSYTVSNPPPSLDTTSATSAMSPHTAVAGSTSITLRVHGANFVYNVTQVDWNGSPLSGATYYNYSSGRTPVTTVGAFVDEIDVPVPAADLAAVGTSQVTVVTPGPGGGTAGPTAFYVTPAGVAVTQFGQATSLASVGTAGVQLPELTVAATGKGTVAVAQYSGDPQTTTPPTPVNAYFDVYVPSGSSFTSLLIQDCNLGGGSMVYYWTGSAWAPVAGQTVDQFGRCSTFTLTNTSTPSILQLSGTPFGVSNVPPVVADPGPQSVQYGQPLSVNVSATDAEPGDTVTVAATGLPAGLSLGTTTFNATTKQWSATVSGTATAPAGTYTASITANDGFSTSVPQSVTITVTRAPLTITASNQQMVLHGSVPALTVSYSGFANGDSAASLTAPPTCSTTATSSSPVGSYPITCSGATDPNYTFSYTAGTLNVTYQVKALYSQTTTNKSGTSVAIKLQLLDANGTNESSSGVAVTLSAPALSPSPSPGAQPSGTFTFMPTSDAGPMYQYNVKSTSFPAHTYTLSFTVARDPVTHTVQFVIS